MYDFFKKHTGKITISLVVVTLILMAIALTLVSSGVTTAVTCIAFITGGASLFTGAYYLGQVEAASEEQESNNNEEQEKDLEAGVMLDNKSREQLMNTDEMVSRREKPAQNNLSETSQKAHLTPSDFFCGFFRALDKQKIEQKRLSDVGEAITRCEEQGDIERSEVGLINKLMHEHNVELAGVLDTLPPCTVSETTPLINYRDKYFCNQRRRELSELINAYPKHSSEAAPTVESVNTYAEARSEHHGKVIALATDLLPDLYALLNEFKDRAASLQRITPS